MALSKNSGRQQTHRHRKIKSRLLPIVLVPVVLAVITAVAMGCFVTARQDKSGSGETESKPPAETGLVESALPDALNPTSSNVPAESKEPERTPNPLDSAAQSLLNSMSIEEKIYQLFIVTPEQLCDVSGTVTQAEPAAQTALQRHPVGGVSFFSGNIQTPEQITRLIEDLQASSRFGLFIAVDEEGGIVARLGHNPKMGTTVFPPMGRIGASDDTENARNVGLTIGNELRQFGFNLNFAPVADVNSNPNNPVIANRSFSSNPQIAANMVAACVSGFKESGVLCTLKHFPGHGDTETDSHYGVASSNKTIEELWNCEFLPFQYGIAAGADMIMIGHISLPNVIGNDTPASLSYEITTGILREQLGFDGLIITDSMVMEAITNRFSSVDAAVQAIQAGADIILMPANIGDAVNGILDAIKSGELTEKRIDESIYRILYTKLAHGIIPLPLGEQ